VLHTACAQAAAWEHGFGRDLSMAVNVSARQLESPSLFDDVRSALTASGISPQLLVLEITETALIGDAPAVVELLQRLRELGPRLAVDDFGTGYSSLSHLQRFPIDILKIDRSFIGDIGSDSVVPDIVRGLLDLARTLRLETVAEGVESPGQLETLQELQCDLGQGYLFARPLSVGDAEQLLRDGTPGSGTAGTRQRRGFMEASVHSPDSS
jgi:EAL domain-containing protein (putative c-di-GMP-specific phosphodiesterase class I)